MNDVQIAIDFIFNCLSSIFALVLSSWATSIILLVSLLSLVIRLYISARQKD